MRKCTSQTEESWANQLKQFCEHEIQTQMNASDGEVFVYEAMVFHGVGLTSFSKEAEVILEYFSGHGCPVSLARNNLHVFVGQLFHQFPEQKTFLFAN